MFNTACSNKAALLATLSNRVCTLLVLVRLSCVLSSLHALLDLLWRVLLQPSAPLAPSVSILRACVSLCVRVGGTLHTCSKACIGRTPLSLSPDSSLWCRKLAFLSVVSALLQPSTTSLPLCLPLCSCTERSLAPSATSCSRLAPAPAARRGTFARDPERRLRWIDIYHHPRREGRHPRLAQPHRWAAYAPCYAAAPHSPPIAERGNGRMGV